MKVGVEAASVSGNEGINSSSSTVDGINSGSCRVLFSAPEASDCWHELPLDEPLCHRIVAIVVDEARVFSSGAKISDQHILTFMSLEH